MSGILDKLKINLLEKFSARGEFWLPENPNTIINGEIIFEPESGVRLELDGSFWEQIDLFNRNFENPKVVRGVLNNGENVSIYKTYYLGADGHFHKARVKLLGSFLFIGLGFDSIEDLKFIKSYVEFTNIKPWLADTVCNLKVKQKKGDSLEVVAKCKTPEELRIKIDEISSELRSLTRFSWGGGDFFEGTKIDVSRGIVLRPYESQGFEWFLEKLESVHSFFEIAIGQEVFMTKVEFHNFDELVDKKRNNTIMACLIFKPQILIEPKRLHPSEVILPCRNQDLDIAIALNNWMKLYNQSKQVLKVFFNASEPDKPFGYQDFLISVQTLESFHRNIFKGRIDETLDMDKIALTAIDALPSNLPEVVKNNIKAKIKFSNELGLRQRLRQLFEYLPQTAESLLMENKSKLINSIIDTRNYYTHIDDETKGSVLDEKGMLYTSIKLKALFYAILLEKMGIPKEKVISIVLKNQRLTYGCSVKVL